MRVLVTGGAGRLGRTVVATLADKGHEVISVDLAGGPASPTGASSSLRADLTQAGEAYGALARFHPEAVVHLAAIAIPYAVPETRLYATNTQLGFNVCRAAADLGVGAVLVASSPTVMGYGNPLGWQPEYLPLDEEHPLAPFNAYALSKQAWEGVVAHLVRQVGEEVRLGVFRPCYVISPDEWDGAATQQGHTVRERLERPELAAVSLFNYLDARDGADFIATWLEQYRELPNGEVFFVSAPDAMATEPLSELLPRYHPGTADLANDLTGTTPAFSNGKAERLLGWKPERSWQTELS